MPKLSNKFQYDTILSMHFMQLKTKERGQRYSHLLSAFEKRPYQNVRTIQSKNHMTQM